ncbi:alpha/beta fold hydrolase [Tsuneonella troitsensis]|uniref:alpha/beta fold hydrolase n=1 Tax=Tsuneonella troitsensis TaxID=292222 RepID=UPI0007102F75|nr:alpha/beta hydrolase [Tsuneonella troitsensis]
MIGGKNEPEAGFVERRWTSSDGLSLYCRDYSGAGGAARLPVVCLHGLTRNSSDFEDIAPLIAATGRRVIVPDVRGRGESQWDVNSANYAPRTYAHDVVELLDALGIGRAVFVGTSMGGVIMMFLALRNRGRIAAAVLNDVGPEVSPEGLARIQSYVGRPVNLASWADAVSYVRTLNESSLPHFDDDDWERMTARTYTRGTGAPTPRYDPAIAAPLNAGKAKAPAFLAWILYRSLVRSRSALVIRGETSDILSGKTAERMAAGRTNVTLVEVPGVGHAPTLSESASRDALLSFLDRVP